MNIIQIPVVSKIAAGQPILAEENLEGYLPVDPTIEAITVDLKDTNFKIIGKAIGQFGKF